MGLDIRIPLGLIFLITGGLMSVYGFITRNTPAIYEKSLLADPHQFVFRLK